MYTTSFLSLLNLYNSIQLQPQHKARSIHIYKIHSRSHPNLTGTSS